jgi:hypothetical protein
LRNASFSAIPLAHSTSFNSKEANMRRTICREFTNIECREPLKAAIFLDSNQLISILECKFPPLSAKTVSHSVNLPTCSSDEAVAPLACPPEQKPPEEASTSLVTTVVRKRERQGEAARQRSCEYMLHSNICIGEPECANEQEVQNKAGLQGYAHSESGPCWKSAGKVDNKHQG